MKSYLCWERIIMGKVIYIVMVMNNSNGVFVDYEMEVLMMLLVFEVVVEVVKDLVNIVCFYDIENEYDVCGW